MGETARGSAALACASSMDDTAQNLEGAPAPERDVAEHGGAAGGGVDEHGALLLAGLGERVGDGRARVHRRGAGARDGLRAVEVAERDVVEAGGDGGGVEVAEGAEPEAALAVAGRPAGDELVQEEDVDGRRVAVRGAGRDLPGEALGVTLRVAAPVREPAALDLARDPGLGEEGQEPDDDWRAGAGHLDARDLRRERDHTHRAAPHVVPAQRIAHVPGEEDAEAARKGLGGGEPDAGVVVAGDDGDRAPPAGGEAVQELEEEVLGPRRGGERLEDIPGYDRERDLVLRGGRDDLGHDGALLALPRQIAEAPAEVQVRDVKEAHGGRKVAPGGGVYREKLPRAAGAGARALGGSGFFTDWTGPASPLLPHHRDCQTMAASSTCLPRGQRARRGQCPARETSCLRLP